MNKYLKSILFTLIATVQVTHLIAMQETEKKNEKEVFLNQLKDKQGVLLAVLAAVLVDLEVIEELKFDLNTKNIEYMYVVDALAQDCKSTDELVRKKIVSRLVELNPDERELLFERFAQIKQRLKNLGQQEESEHLRSIQDFEKEVLKVISKPVWYHHILYANLLTKVSLVGCAAAVSYIAYDKWPRKNQPVVSQRS